MENPKCLHCGKEFKENRSQIYCSRACNYRAQSAKNYELKKARRPIAKAFDFQPGDCPFAAGKIHDVELFGLAMCCPGDTMAVCHA